MGRLTDQLYAAWLTQNGAGNRSKPPTGGMGVMMTPMQATRSPAKPASRVQTPAPAPVLAARPAKRYSYISE